MTLALDKDLPSNLLKNLIVVDIPPIKGSVSRTTISYIEAMRRIEDLKLTGSSIRKEADELLIDVEKVVLPTTQTEVYHNVSTRILQQEPFSFQH